MSRAQAYRLLDVARSLAAIHDAVTAGAETSRTRAINPATLDYGLSQRALIDVSSHSGGRPDRRRATRRRRRPRRSTHAIGELMLEVAPAHLSDTAAAHVLAPLCEEIGVGVHVNVRRIESVTPVAVTTSPAGRTVVDFGQNLVGRLRIRVRGEAGRTVTLRHAEVLENGELCTRPLRHATATDRYTLRGDTDGEVWDPVSPSTAFATPRSTAGRAHLDPADVTVLVLHSDLRPTGWFSCSDASLNRLHENVVWGMRGNCLDVPTDCPQRDERLGWTGDVQLFAPTAAFRSFLRSFLRDLAADQSDDERGIPPVFSPDIPVITPVAIPPATRRWPDGVTPLRSSPGCCTSDTATPRYCAPSTPRCAPGSTPSTASPGPAGSGGEGFQFGDWLDPTAPTAAAQQVLDVEKHASTGTRSRLIQGHPPGSSNGCRRVTLGKIAG